MPGAEPLLVGLRYEAAKASAAEMHGRCYEVAMAWTPLGARLAESPPNPLGRPHFRQIAPNQEESGVSPGERPLRARVLGTSEVARPSRPPRTWAGRGGGERLLHAFAMRLRREGGLSRNTHELCGTVWHRMARRPVLTLTATRSRVTSWHTLAWKRPLAKSCRRRMGLQRSEVRILSPRPFQHLGVVGLARGARPSRFRSSAEFAW